ncbi:MAG: hypothetical protein CL762_03730 [Chloroflexi bacterium]|nr:hypothetical protein [Chloroflexota bacterium]
MKKNIIINGINDESRALYEDLLDHNLDDVIFIDSNRELVNDLNYKSDSPIAYLGNPISPEFLEFVGINREDSEAIFVSMTDSDSVNLISCEIAKLKFELSQVISIVNSKENVPLFNAYGISELVLREKSIIEIILNTAGVTLPIRLMDIQLKGTSVWSIRIPSGSEIIGDDLSKLKIPFRAIILGKIDSKGNPYQSTENIDIEEDDTILIISSNRNEESMTRFFQGKENGQ